MLYPYYAILWGGFAGTYFWNGRPGLAAKDLGWR